MRLKVLGGCTLGTELCSSHQKKKNHITPWWPYFRNRAYKEIKLNEVIKGGALIHYDRCPYKRVCPSSVSTEERLCQGTAWRQSTIIQGEWLQEKPTLPKPPSPASSPQDPEKMNLCCLSHPVCGILLRQPWQTNTPYLVLWCKGLYSHRKSVLWPSSRNCRTV